MGEVSTIGLDIGKSVFQIHGVDVAGVVVIRKRISRAKLLEFFATLPACLVGIEACPTAHYWSRQLQALGHTVRLLPPSYVKAYLKRSKNDANDAAAICEASRDHRCGLCDEIHIWYWPNCQRDVPTFASERQ